MYAAPFNAPNVLVLDTATGAVYGVSTEDLGAADVFVNAGDKWRGITAVGGTLYGQPPQPTRFILAQLKAGETVYQAGELPKVLKTLRLSKIQYEPPKTVCN